MTADAPHQGPTVDLDRLSRRAPVAFDYVPDAEALARLRADLGLRGLRKLRLKGVLAPLGRADWTLEGHLGATVVQTCVVTLAPVTARIETEVSRRYLDDFQTEDAAETEMPEDDSAEPKPAALDLDGLAAEALALALPDYPRAAEADLGQSVFSAPGTAPMTDEDARPFAALRVLRGGSEDDAG